MVNSVLAGGASVGVAVGCIVGVGVLVGIGDGVGVSVGLTVGVGVGAPDEGRVTLKLTPNVVPAVVSIIQSCVWAPRDLPTPEHVVACKVVPEGNRPAGCRVPLSYSELNSVSPNRDPKLAGSVLVSKV